MATMSAADREAALRWLLTMHPPAVTGANAHDVPQMLAAVAAMDVLIDGQGTAINAAFPEPFKSQATTPQKIMVFVATAMKRAGII